MTHDELLDRIAQAGLEPHGNVMPTHLVLALRAVVEWHSPEDTGCLGCGYDQNYSEWNQSWPCPTIQAIEKELA